MAGLKETFPGSKVVSGDVKAPMDLTTAFDDIATHPDDLPAGKPDNAAKKKDRAKIKAAVEALEAQRK